MERRAQVIDNIIKNILICHGLLEFGAPYNPVAIKKDLDQKGYDIIVEHTHGNLDVKVKLAQIMVTEHVEVKEQPQHETRPL